MYTGGSKYGQGLLGSELGREGWLVFITPAKKLGIFFPKLWTAPHPLLHKVVPPSYSGIQVPP
jgi:hypothetical protein